MATKVFVKGVYTLLIAASLAACNSGTIEGKWVEPIPGMEDQIQGVSLEKGGKASSINMATLQYEKWERKGKVLMLTGKSIGNSVTIPFTDTLTIEKLTNDELILRKGDLTINYHKQ